MKKFIAIALCALPALSARATFYPAVITSGFNADIIANGTGPAAGSSMPLDFVYNYALVSEDYQAVAGDPLPVHALPAGGNLSSVGTNGLSFQLADYGGPNALFLNADTASGTLQTSIPGAAALYLLVTGANGSTDFSATVNFSDATSETFNNLSAPDWYGYPGYATAGIGRVYLADNSLEGDADNPRLYEVQLALSPANYSKSIVSVDISANALPGSAMGVLAVSFNSPCSGTPSAGTALSSANTICANNPFSLSLANSFDGATVFEWQVSPDAIVWSTLGTGISSDYTTSQTTASYYRCVVTCTATGLSDTSSEIFVDIQPVSACYCIPVYFNPCNTFVGEVDINDLSLTGENGTSISQSGSGCSGGYGDYTALPAVDLNEGGTYTLNYLSSSTILTSCSVWIDLDHDGTWSAAELVGTTDWAQDQTLTITLPAGLLSGPARMRVRNNLFSPANDPCASLFTGEAEDYTVNILGTVLPITLAGISARQLEGRNIISWTTLQEAPGSHFELEKSADGVRFSFLMAINGKGRASTYDYVDLNPLKGATYYRLKVVDADGSYRYSRVIHVISDDAGPLSLQVLPNPTEGTVYVTVVGGTMSEASLFLRDLTGRILKIYKCSNGSQQIDMSVFAKGVYLIEYRNETGSKVVRVMRQ